MLRGLALVSHRAMLRTARTPLGFLWALPYRAFTYVVVRYLVRGERDAASYLRASFALGDAIYGLSDVDIALVVSGNPRRIGETRDRVLRRWQRLCRIFPWLPEVFDIAVYEDILLEDVVAASVQTYDLARARPPGSISRAMYFGREPLYDGSALREQPRVHGPLSDWRRHSGPERRPPVPPQEPQDRRMAAWLELQFYWRYAFQACVIPGSSRTRYLCVKLVAEPARIWLWLAHGERVARRADILRRALEVLPEEEQAFRDALELYRTLSRTAAPPLAEFLPPFVRLSARVAEHIVEELEEDGTTDVVLVGRDEPLAVPDGAGGMRQAGPADELLPLVDWRALVWPALPDEAFALTQGDPTDPVVVGRLADRKIGTHPVLRTDGLLILPTRTRGMLRAVQCIATDPVSFALADGVRSARFPNVPGWSARDWARRAVAEHWAWLESRRDNAPPTSREWPDREARRESAPLRALARLFTAARAALFLQSVEAGAPELPLTVAGVADRLREPGPEAEAVASAAYDEYRKARAGGSPPSERTVAALTKQVLQLEPYAGAVAARRAGARARGGRAPA